MSESSERLERSENPIAAAAAENAERPADAARPAGAGNGTEAELQTNPEANEVDTFEQQLGLAPEDAEEEERTPPVPPLEVDPADAAEQHRVVPLDDDDYR